MSLPVDDLECPVCCDIFIDPVLLSCSHSFCRECVKRCWETSGSRECPMCRKRASKASPTTNLALRNLCETVQVARRESSSSEKEKEKEKELNCDLHGEKLKLFCLVDKQPICLVCHMSKTHKNHDCSTLEEAVIDCRGELSTTLTSLQEKMDSLKIIHSNSNDTIDYIKNQAIGTRQEIKAQFERLHHVLHREESERLAALKREEDQKISGMRDKVSEISEEMLSLEESFNFLESELNAEDMALLQNFKGTRERCSSLPLGPVTMSGTLIDVSKHLGNLKYSIWENMNHHIEYTPVTLDPNTAHPYLILSDDLTSLYYSGLSYGCPDNPERFQMSAEVVGTNALGSGSHHWIVETGSNRDWLLGVTSVSAPRNVVISARPENGFWTLCYRGGEFRAMTSPPTTLSLATEAPISRIKVQLDYNKGTLCFFDGSGYDRLLYTFESTFTEMVLPYFYTHSQHPLRILPESVMVTALRKEGSAQVV
ncbi:zinc-binding protein A33 [Gadus morhua]|uniref:Zinc-binding protein A33-like n=1 Tax=Gadus morhua TaxID=8049 RepID=A0A8C4Z7A7_GADMO|nr:zinc-binding protein A33-like [Gadus morhua]